MPESLQPSYLHLRAPLSPNREVFIFVPNDFDLADMEQLQRYLAPWTASLKPKNGSAE